MAGNIIGEATSSADNEDTVVKYLEGAIEVLLWLNDDANQEQGAEWFSQVMLEESAPRPPRRPRSPAKR